MMKKTLLISFITILFVYLVYRILLFNCEIANKCDFCFWSSESIAFSKENNYFEFELIPLKDTMFLANHDMYVTFQEVWFEKRWRTNTDNCFNQYDEVAWDYNFRVNFTQSDSGVYLFQWNHIIYDSIEEEIYGYSEGWFNTDLEAMHDTIFLQIAEKDPLVGWRNSIKGEKIGFVRKID